MAWYSRRMQVRWIAALAAAAIAGAPAAAIAADSADSTSSEKKSRHKKAKKSSKKKSSRERRAERRKKRAAERKKIANMPEGWRWPPNRAMRAMGKDCKKQLNAMGIAWKRAKREGRIATPIETKSMMLGGVKIVSMYKKPPFTMDCHLALGLATHLPKLYEIGVREIHFSSIFRDTKVRVDGQEKKARSRHSLGLAIDLRQFVDEAGRISVVETDYASGSALLLQIEEVLNATGGFRTVLTPRNDPKSHWDHFHLEVQLEYPDAKRSGSSS